MPSRCLRDGIGLYPDNASLHENLAVLLLAALDVAGSIAACETALALGSDSPNVRDCLCEAYQCAGRSDLAVEAGRLALEAKDHRFGILAPLVAMPDGPPPAFDPNRPEQNVIAYTLWGNQPRYQVPLLEMPRSGPICFPSGPSGFTMTSPWTPTTSHNSPPMAPSFGKCVFRRACRPFAACYGGSR